VKALVSDEAALVLDDRGLVLLVGWVKEAGRKPVKGLGSIGLDRVGLAKGFEVGPHVQLAYGGLSSMSLPRAGSGTLAGLTPLVFL
jgi:hypothetical protein